MDLVFINGHYWGHMQRDNEKDSTRQWVLSSVFNPYFGSACGRADRVLTFILMRQHGMIIDRYIE